MHDELEVTLDEIGWTVPLDRPVGRLTLAEQQMVEIVRAFHHRADLVLLDEPNSALTEAEIGPSSRPSAASATAVRPSCSSRIGSTRSWRSPTR